ncbi:MAG TPA: HD domain-containing protein [Williamwhitmania sp.]|nr:HD domain-containing protein [Williamwhitmania sp.]
MKDYQQESIEKTYQFVEQFHKHDTTGHDWWHVERVTRTAKKLAVEENANLFLVEMAALLHDIDDWKLGHEENNKTEVFLQQISISAEEKHSILKIIDEVSFKGAEVATPTSSIESMCVQDADRLDAIGAIGVARAFTYGGSKNRSLYEPDVAPTMHHSFGDYKTKHSHTINHFYEKLLLLKERINTPTAKAIAKERHAFMEQFLAQFYREWNAE